MASIDRVMALAEELKKKKKDPNYQINQSMINVSDLATDMKSGNKDALKNFIESDRSIFDAPIKTTVTNKSNVKDTDKKWYQQVFTKGEFEDGVDGVGDFFSKTGKTILGTGMDLTEGLAKGIFSPIESVVDIGTNIGATALNALGKEDTAKKWRDFADKDLTSNFVPKVVNATPTGIAYNILNGEPEKALNPTGLEWDKDKSVFGNAKQAFNKAYLTESNEAYEDSSVMGYYADKTTELVGYALGLIYGGQALTGATGTKAVGLTNTAGKTMVGASASGGNIGLTLNGMTLNVPTLAFTGGMASGLQEANSKENVTEAERWTKAFSSGAIEGATEGLFGMFGVGGVTNQAGQEIFDVAGSKAASLFKSSVGKTLANAGIKATGEAAEEFIAYSLNYLSDNHIIDKMGEADFSNEWNWKELGETLALSFASSMIMQGGGGVIQTNSAIAEAEKQLGRKLTSQEKALVTQASIEGTLEQKVSALQGNTQEVQTPTNNLTEQTNQQPANIEQETNNEVLEEAPLKNSKVRDEKGDLITVYHGTRADFDTYDTSKAGQNYEGNWSNNGKGIYFTDNKAEALEYAKSSIDEGDPKIKEAQLDITNPFDSSKDYTTELSEMAQEYGIDPYYLERGDRLFSWFNKNNKDIVEALKKYGYDGIVDHGHYTVFDSKQIKNVEKQTEPKRKTMTQKKMENIEGSKKTNQDGYEYTVPNSLFRGQRTAPTKGDSVTLAKYGEAEYYTPRKARAEAFGEVTEYNNMEEKFQNPYIQGTPYNSKMIELLEEFKKNNPDRASHVDKALKQGFPLTQEYMTPKEMKDLYLKAGYDSFIGGSDSAPEYLSFTNDNAKQDTQVSESITPLEQELSDLTNELKKTIKDTKKEIKSLKNEIKEVKTDINEAVDEFKALTEADLPNIEQQSSETLKNITDEDIAPVIEDTTPEYEPTTIESPLEAEGRDIDSVGNRKVKAYQYENPEVRPYFQAEARVMLDDLHNSVKGEKVWTEEFNPATGLFENAYVTGTKRVTTSDIAYLLDNYNYTYADIEKGLNAIIEDHGAENIAVAKRIEFMLDERLREGYTSIDGTEIPANQEYINLLQGMEQTKQYSEAPLGEAPVEVVEEVAPIVEKASNTQITEEIAPTRSETDWDSVEDTSKGKQLKYNEESQIIEEDLVKKTKKELRKALLGTEAQKDFILSALDNAKNRSMAFMNNTDTIRNTELVFGRDAGRVINEAIFQKEINNEADSIKWQNQEREDIKKLGIKARSKESAAVQKYGEKQYVNEHDVLVPYGDTELASEFPDVATQERIKNAAKEIRNKYDNYIERANGVLTKLGFDPIPKRNDYMRHFQELNDVFSRWGLPFNAKNMQEHTLPTDINGLTEFWSPQKNYFANIQPRKGIKTEYDAITGVDGYIGGIANLIYHTEDIQRGRAFEELIRETYGEDKGWENLDNLPDELKQARAEKIQDNHLSNYAAWVHEWTNNVAGKKNKLDRSVEAVFGRKAFSFLDQTRKQVGANMIGFNVSSSLTNLIAPVQALAKTNKLAVVKGTADTIKNIFVKDSFMNNNRFLTSRMGTDMLSQTPWQKVQSAGYVFMKGVDWFSSNQIVRSKYYELRAKGMSETQAHAEAGKFAARIMGDRTKGANAQIYNSKLLGLVTQFQLEVNNQLYSQFYDTYHESKEATKGNALKTAAGMTFTLGQLFAFTHLFGQTFQAIAGYNPTFDIVEILKTALGWGDDDEKTTSERLKEAADQLVDALPYVNILTGGGRIPVASGIPNLVGVATGGKDQYGNELTLEDELKKLLYLIPPTGGNQVKKTTQGLSMFDEDLPVSGSYTDSGNLRFPVEDTPLNKLQAGLFGQWSNKNAREYFDNERQPLKEKQIEEYVDLDLPIADYWEYRDGLKKQKTLEEKFEYINGLDVTTEQKNIMINNVVDRKEEVDMSNYDDFGSYEEFDFAIKNEEKYNFLQENNISYEEYNASEESREAYNWAFNNPESYVVSKAITNDVVTYRRIASDIYDLKADKDSSGKSISGSRKEKVIDYVNNLDVDYEARLILYKMEYTSDDSANYDIINYLNERDDITYEEMVTILTKLDMTVDSEGNITW